jgi:hypothetical protein
MLKLGIHQQEEYDYMVVKEVKREGGFVYFKVLSSCCVHGLILKMDEEMFVRRFNCEHGRMCGTEDSKKVFRSRDFIFPEKIKWWNNNVKEVDFLYKTYTMETEVKLIDICEEYCRKFKIDKVEFKRDFEFFENFLHAYEIGGSGYTVKSIGKKRKKHDRYRN